MLTRESITYVESHRDLHFTDELVASASEYETLPIPSRGVSGPARATPYAALPATLGQARSFITSLRLTAATNHAFTVAFYTREVKDQRLGATPYAGTLIDFWPWVAGDAFRMGPGTEYVYAVSNMKIPYMDEDGTNSIHVGLFNRSTSTKGALGAALPSGVPPQYLHLRIGLISAT